jgi:hypothetical protein
MICPNIHLPLCTLLTASQEEVPKNLASPCYATGSAKFSDVIKGLDKGP